MLTISSFATVQVIKFYVLVVTSFPKSFQDTDVSISISVSVCLSLSLSVSVSLSLSLSLTLSLSLSLSLCFSLSPPLRRFMRGYGMMHVLVTKYDTELA